MRVGVSGRRALSWGLMDPTRGTLHERHHANTLHPDVLILEPASGLGEVRMQISNAENDSGERLLAIPKMSNSSILSNDHSDAILRREDDLLLPPPDVESALNSTPRSLRGVRSWDEIHKRFGGLQDDLDTLDIMREASRILRKEADLFTSLAAALILPVSIIVLTGVVITRPVITWVQTHLEGALFEESVAAGIRTPVSKFIYLRIAGFLLASVLDIPLAISLAALSKAGIIYTVAYTYGGLKVSFVDFIHRVVPKVWIPLVITYFSSLAIFIGVGVIALLLVEVANGLFAALHPPSSLMLLVFTILGLIVCGVFLYIKIILNVANVICVLEDKYGFAALARSFSILQPRIQVALGSYLVAFFCAGFVTLLFEYRITDKNYYTEHNASATWEGPLLLLLHSFVYLFADIMTTVLYFTCPYKSSRYEALDAPSRVSDFVGSVR